MRAPFDEDLTPAELRVLYFFVKRGGLLPEEQVRRGLRRTLPNVGLALEGLRGSWLEQGRARGTVYWALIDLARTARLLRDRGALPPHHGGRTQW